MAELTDLMDGLAKLDANVTKIPLKEIADEFFDRSPECTPQQVRSISQQCMDVVCVVGFLYLQSFQAVSKF